LLNRLYTPGEYVRKGTLLFTIEDTRYRDDALSAKATLASARSSADYYEQQLEALTRALNGNAVSKMEVLQAKSNLESAQAQIRSAEAALSTAEMMLAKCQVRAPVSGYISEATVSPGNYISGGTTPQTLATIYDNSRLKALFNVENSHYEQMHATLGNNRDLFRRMPITFEEELPHQYTADLRYQSPSVSETTGMIKLIGYVDNQDNELKDGMYLTISLPYGVDSHAVLVRDASISTDQLGKFLYVVNDSNKVVYTPISVGPLYHDTLRVVKSGINPGQRYVKDALLTVRPGEEVRVKR
jgi:RND family efflux transporter MFP subunit